MIHVQGFLANLGGPLRSRTRTRSIGTLPSANTPSYFPCATCLLVDRDEAGSRSEGHMSCYGRLIFRRSEEIKFIDCVFVSHAASISS